MQWIVTIAAFLIVFIIGATVYLQPNDFLSCRDMPVSGTSCDKADAIVVVSGGNTNARTEAGVELLKNGWADKIVFSGAAEDKSGPSNAAAMRLHAMEQGISSDAIILDEDSETTQQNAEKTKSIFEDNNFKNIILVTSGYHQRRASLEFDKRAGDITIRNHPITQDGDWGWWWWMTPRGWWLTVSELAKIVAFYLGAIA